MSGLELRTESGLVSGILVGGDDARPDLPLLACIHGGGCNGRYFDVEGHSTLSAARSRGFPVFLVNRPGYGGNRCIEGPSPISAGVPHIRGLIERARACVGAAGVFALGHSIGGAVALMLATTDREGSILGVAVSGLGDEPPPGAWDGLGEHAPASLAAADFLGPEGSWDWRTLTRLRQVSEPWDVREISEIRREWPCRWPEVARAVAPPVHLRLADHEAIWVTGQAVVDRMAAALTRSARVDAALLPDGGHLYELHRRGPELLAAQLDFAESCAT